MKILKKLLLGFVFLLAILLAVIYSTGNSHIMKGLKNTYLIGKSKPDIDDFGSSDVRKIPIKNPQAWNIGPSYNEKLLSDKSIGELESYDTKAFLVIHKDSIIHEKYWGEYDKHTLSNSFSMAKSILAVAIGVALKEGKIKSLDQKVSEYIDGFDEGYNSELSIRHLLLMSSGIDFGESYSNPFGYQAKAYYGNDLIELTVPFKASAKPGSFWRYEGGNSVFLGMILKRVTGQEVSEYFSEKVWEKIGAEDDAFWGLDHESGFEKTFSAFYSTARDFSRMGKLYLNNGKWNGEEIVSQVFVEECVSPVESVDSDGNQVDYYGFHWWMGKYNSKEFYCMRGMRGQYVMVVPEDELIVTRLGHERDDVKKDYMPIDMYKYLDAAYEIID